MNMDWLDRFYSRPVAIPLSLGALLVIGLLVRHNVGRQAILGLSLFLYLRYLWCGVGSTPFLTIRSPRW
jgi:hypothetical protein